MVVHRAPHLAACTRGQTSVVRDHIQLSWCCFVPGRQADLLSIMSKLKRVPC